MVVFVVEVGGYQSLVVSDQRRIASWILVGWYWARTTSERQEEVRLDEGASETSSRRCIIGGGEDKKSEEEEEGEEEGDEKVVVIE